MDFRIFLCAAAVALMLCCVALACRSSDAEPFAFARDLCDAIDPDNVSPKVLELCKDATEIPNTCTVGCDTQTLCSNPSVGVCNNIRIDKDPAVCDITSQYIPRYDRVHTHRIFSVRRGGCLVSDGGTSYKDGTGIRNFLASFPSHLSVVKNSILGRSALSGTWVIRLMGDGDTVISLPLRSDAFQEEVSTLPKLGKTRHVPVMWEEITSISPNGLDTSRDTDEEHLKKTVGELSSRSSRHLHVTMEFNVPDTLHLKVGDLEYNPPIPGKKAKSPVSRTEMPAVCSVWLCVTMDLTSGTISEAREIISSRDGTVTISKVVLSDTSFSAGSPVSHMGTAPSIWTGIRDGRRAAERNSVRRGASYSSVPLSGRAYHSRCLATGSGPQQCLKRYAKEMDECTGSTNMTRSECEQMIDSGSTTVKCERACEGQTFFDDCKKVSKCVT
nr:hypothetical protein TetV2_00302 [Oceanusvirus sp.]